ncbi:PerC family transcriptional regulator [Escherichia coli]|uniref:PerC family transcriptional regulator n=1 Tax=Escherichia coli TaxID=562 RepID=UPI002024CDE2|nr:PerC family transcriptional regulator [Escherichia coli]
MKESGGTEVREGDRGCVSWYRRQWWARNFCLGKISSPPLPEKLDISEVAKAAEATLRRMGIASPSGEIFRKGTPVC